MARRKKPRSVSWWLKKTSALIRDNHFVLKSGKHSDGYLNKDAIYPHTGATSAIARRLAIHFADKDVDAVVGPEKGGIILAQWVAYHLNRLNRKAKNKKRVLALYAEKDIEGFMLRRGYSALVRGKKVLVVEDVLTSGNSARSTIEAVKGAGGEIVSLGALCNRGEATAESLGVPELFTLVRLRLPDWDAAGCPLCAKNIPINTELGHGQKYLENKNQTPP